MPPEKRITKEVILEATVQITKEKR